MISIRYQQLVKIYLIKNETDKALMFAKNITERIEKGEELQRLKDIPEADVRLDCAWCNKIIKPSIINKPYFISDGICNDCYENETKI